MDAYEIFNSLEGSWKISRTISHRGKMHGIATFTRIKAGEFLYREDGTFTSDVNFQAFKVFRENYFCYMENTIKIFVINNNRPDTLLHALYFINTDGKPYSPQSTSEYLCGQDTYSVHYSFFADEIYSRYNISGPNKNYTITTQFSRLRDNHYPAAVPANQIATANWWLYKGFS